MALSMITDISETLREEYVSESIGKELYRQLFFGGVVSKEAVHYWMEDNLEPRDPLPWLDHALQAVRGRAWS